MGWGSSKVKVRFTDVLYWYLLLTFVILCSMFVCKTFCIYTYTATLGSSDYVYAVLHQQLKLFVCVEVLRPSQPNGVMSSAVSLPNHTFTGQA